MPAERTAPRTASDVSVRSTSGYYQADITALAQQNVGSSRINRGYEEYRRTRMAERAPVLAESTRRGQDYRPGSTAAAMTRANVLISIKDWARDSGIPDIFALPAGIDAARQTLSAHLSAYLVARLDWTKGQQENGKVKASQVRVWCEQIVAVTASELSERQVPSRRITAILHQNGGVHCSLRKQAAHLARDFNLSKRRKPTVTYGRAELALILADLQDYSRRPEALFSSVELDTDFEELLLFLFGTGHRPGAFLPSTREGYLRLGNMHVLQTSRGIYAITGVTAPLKGTGLETDDEERSPFYIASPTKSQNFVFELPMRVIASLLKRRAIINPATGRPFGSTAEFQASNASEFSLSPADEPKIRSVAPDGTVSPLTANSAASRLRNVCRRVGLPFAKLYNFRKGSSNVWFGPEQARFFLGHGRGSDVAADHYFLDPRLSRNLAAVLFDSDADADAAHAQFANTVWRQLSAPAVLVAVHASRRTAGGGPQYPVDKDILDHLCETDAGRKQPWWACVLRPRRTSGAQWTAGP